MSEDDSTTETGESAEQDTAVDSAADNSGTASAKSSQDGAATSKPKRASNKDATKNREPAKAEPDTDPAMTDLAAVLAELNLTPQQIKGRLDASKKWEQRAKDNVAAAREKQTAEQRMAELEKALEERDARDAERDVREVERAGKLAITQLHAQLAQNGINKSDVQDVLSLVDPIQFLTDGEPDEKAIAKFASSLSKVAGRATPDPDQGRRSSGAPKDMNQALRAAVRGGSTRNGLLQQ